MLRKFSSSLYINFLSNKAVFSNSKILRDDDQLSQTQIDQILGNEPKQKKENPNQSLQKSQQSEINKVRQLFYNLIPIKNEIFPICHDPQQITIQQTPNQNIFNALKLSKDCSYQQYSSSLSEFRTQTDLYGDQQEKSQIQLQDLQFKELLKYDSKYIVKARQRALVNISIPGSIQVEDPRNFMSLRPIEQFRHTPLVPISEQAMKKHQQMLEQYHRRQFVFEIKKQSVINFVMLAASVGFCGYLIYLVLQKEEQRTVAYSRLKFKRTMGQESDVKFRI